MLFSPSTKFKASQFTWNGNHGVAEASDLGNFSLQPIYDDACDEGFAVVSDRTGMELVFAYTGPEYADGEITHFNFECATAGWRDFRITLFND